MGWMDDVGRGALGVSTGGLSELFQGNPFGAQGNFFKNGQYSQQPLQTPEQKAALAGLMQFANTGTFGNFTAGTPYTGSLGDFSMTSLENKGQSKLSDILSSSLPGSFGLGTDEIKKLLTTNSYDPNNDHGVYSGLTAGIDYNTQKATNAAKQAGAYAGNLYSSGVGRNIGDVQAQGANQKSNILAQLYQNFSNQKLGAIPLALNAGTGEQALNMNQVGAAYQYGALPRTLNTAQDQAQYGEFQRQRQEQMLPLQMLQSIYTSKPEWGFPSVSTPSPWNKLLDTAVSVGSTAAGYAFGGPAGGAVGSQIGSSFKPSSFGAGGNTYLDQYNAQPQPNSPINMNWRQ